MKHHHFRLLFCFLLIPFSLFLTPIHAQTWEPVGKGVTGGDTLNSSPVTSLCVYNNKLYVGGTFKYAGKLEANHIASWDGIRWDTLSCGTNDFVETLCVYKKMLCVGGVFDRAGRTDVNYLAYWTDTNNTTKGWEQIGSVIKPVVHRTAPLNRLINGFTEWQGWLYILTNQPTYSNSYKTVLKWSKGQSLQPLCKAMTQGEPNLNLEKASANRTAPDGSCIPGYIKGNPVVIATYKNKLCIAGPYAYNNNNNKYFTAVSEWEGNTMKLLGKDTLEHTGWPYCLCIHDSDLFVGCGYSSKYGTIGVAKWNGSCWKSVGKMIGEGDIFCMEMYKGKLYAGGKFDSICGKPANGIACWDGNNWEPVGAGFSKNQKKRKASVHALCVYKDELYAAGEFYTSGDKTVMNIAKLNLSK